MPILMNNGQIVLFNGQMMSGAQPPTPNVMEYWNDYTFPTFVTDGIDITSAIGTGIRYCRSNHFNVIGGLPEPGHTFGIINVKFDIVINSAVNLYTYFTNYTHNSTSGNSITSSGSKEYDEYVVYTGENEFSFGFEVKTGGNANFSVSNIFITVTDW